MTNHGTFTDEQLAEAFDALCAGDDRVVARFDTDELGAERLVAYVTRPVEADRFARCERPDPRRGAHPARLLLHALARQFRYDGSSPDLGGDYVEALDGCLGRGATAWADSAAGYWFNWILHEGETVDAWTTAHSIIEGHDRAALPPRLLASFAAIAERAGDIDEAVELWQMARMHPATASSAQVRWIVDFEWARNHLLLSGGAPVRAARVLERAHVGLSRFTDERGRLIYINVALELVFVLTLIGRTDDAISVVARSRAAVAGNAELEPWLAGVESLALAVAGRTDDARAALRECESASMDTSSLELAATIPAAMLIHAARRDHGELDSAIARARAHEAQKLVDIELRVAWRIYAVLALVIADARPTAVAHVMELRSLAQDSAVPLPTYEPFIALLDAFVREDERAEADARAALEQRGVVVAAHARDPWQRVATRDAVASDTGVVLARVRIEVLAGLSITIDGDPVTPAAWSSRRKAQSALAALVAAGNTIDRASFTNGMWDEELASTSTVDGRVFTLLSKVRSVLRAGNDPERDARSVVIHPGSIILKLAPGDSTDVAEMRRIARLLSQVDPRGHTELEQLAHGLLPLITGTPLEGVGTESIIVDWRERLVAEVVETVTRVCRAWLSATSGDDASAPVDAMLDIARHAVRLDPVDELAATVQVELLTRAGRRADASRAFHRYRTRLAEELGLQPSREIIRVHALAVDLEDRHSDADPAL